jgi:hypothetical protein
VIAHWTGLVLVTGAFVLLLASFLARGANRTTNRFMAVNSCAAGCGWLLLHVWLVAAVGLGFTAVYGVLWVLEAA